MRINVDIKKYRITEDFNSRNSQGLQDFRTNLLIFCLSVHPQQEAVMGIIIFDWVL